MHERDKASRRSAGQREEEEYRRKEGEDGGGDGTADILQTPVTLTFDPNGGENEPAPIPAVTRKIAGVELNSAEIAIPEEEPTREYYTFAGWSEKADDTPNDKLYKYDADKKTRQDITISEDTTLYAIWVKNYVLHFEANGGKDAPADQILPSQSPSLDSSGNVKTDANGNKIYVGRMNITDQKPTRTGYNFLGWSTSKVARSASFAPGDEVQIEGGDVTLYAVWSRANGNTYAGGSTAGNTPRTGDESNPILYIVLAVIALAGAVAAALIYRKKSRK